jgi:ABC-type multidrug transport system permease subunit
MPLCKVHGILSNCNAAQFYAYWHHMILSIALVVFIIYAFQLLFLKAELRKFILTDLRMNEQPSTL